VVKVATIADCENCGLVAEAVCRYLCHSDGVWHEHLFCCGACMAEWVRNHEGAT
jgi:hypothetical protein